MLNEYSSTLLHKVALENFSWDRVWQELVNKIPTLLTGGSFPKNVKPAICTCANILRTPKVNVVQATVSVVLKAGHASFEV